ncbi:DUF302 domain-containing protein [Methylonatrum kenyense]|uniref:DUF302 domain-containing protein n=1 Tax=Methylonatrum kenyense TaxID=455253 RepID=UPI0020BFA7E9|nr:DUF302 domain-containing protein [Methylonatrum kenyense]
MSCIASSRQCACRLVAGGLLSLLLVACGSQADEVIMERSDKTLDEVLFDLEFAASTRNFVITGRTQFGEALESRGVNTLPGATVIQMCDLDLVTTLLEAKPDLIRYMPCRVAVYPDGDEVVASSLRVPEDNGDERADTAARRLNETMHAIIREGVE